MYAKYLHQIADVASGRKPVTVVSAGKVSEDEFWNIHAAACALASENLPTCLLRAHCADGQLHDHLLFGASFHVEIVGKLILKARAGIAPEKRADFQGAMGALLGYPEGDIASFLTSDEARTCPCDCCGGPDTVEVAA